MGEIKLPTLMPEAEQLAEVKRQAEAYVNSLPEDEAVGGGKAFKIVDAYNITLLDPTKPMQYNRERVEVKRTERPP